MGDFMEYPYFPDRIIEEMKINSAFRDRRIFINEEVDRDTMFKANYLLDRIYAIDEKEGKPVKDRKPIELVIDSYGGHIYHGLALISNIERLKEIGYVIITTVQGVAMSMGAWILSVGTIRRALRHARIMFHQPSSGSWGDLENMQRDVEETECLWQRMKDLAIKYTSVTDEKLEYHKKLRQDWFMWADEALENKIIDEIL